MRAFKIAALAAPLLLVAGCAKSPESTVESFYTAVGKGQITEAQSYLSQQIVALLGPQKISAALAKESARVGECGGIKSVEVKLSGEGEVRQGSATVSYKGQCPAKTEAVKLIQEDGKWKIGAAK